MKWDRATLYAIAFVVLIAIIAAVVWFLQISTPSGTATNTSRGGFFGSLFPFGRSDSTVGAGVGEGDQLTDTTVVPELRRLSSEPVSGGGFVKGSGGVLAVRYVERNTGHIYETPVALSTLVRLTNSTVPAVHDSTLLSASTTLMRFLSDTNGIQNFVGVIATTSTDQDLQGGFLKDYTRIAVGTKNALLGVFETPEGSSVESLTADGKNIKTLFTSSVASWIPHLSSGKYYLASAPSGQSDGSAYEIKTGTLVRALASRTGFQALFQTDGPLVAVTGGSKNALSLAMYDLKNGGMLEMPVGTLVQKCAWAAGRSALLVCAIPKSVPPGMYPDDWLLGITHTDDDLYEINTDTGAVTRVFDLSESGSGPFDVAQVQLSDDGSYFLFVNRNDQTLWSAKLTQQSQ